MRSIFNVSAIAVLSIASTTCLAQQPQIVHAQVSSKAAAQGLAAELELQKRQGDDGWVGYSVPVVHGFHTNWDNGTAYLEDDHRSNESRHEDERSSDQAEVLLRITGGNVEKIRVESPERQLDAGGQRFVCLTNVAVNDSVAVLSGLAKGSGTKRLRDTAVFAVAVHQTPTATQSLVGLAGAGNEFELRDKAAFWLANQRGREGFLAIQRLAREDGDAAFREKLTFDLTLTHEPEAVAELVRIAHTDASVKVRRQAQFWMAQKGGKIVTGDLRQMAENDPESSLRKSAVFAVSRLPQEEATPQLIQLAQTGKDPVVRKQAVFWLGQSSDPKALDYLTQLIQR